jgi:hypothetical protein
MAPALLLSVRDFVFYITDLFVSFAFKLQLKGIFLNYILEKFTSLIFFYIHFINKISDY